MLFNSIEFLIFLPLVFFSYWYLFSKRLVSRNIFLLAVSYLFYGWWDWRFLSLIIFSSAVDFVSGKKIYRSNDKRCRRIWVCVSVLTNLGFLGFFKYFNFFSESFADLMSTFGFQINAFSLQVILPVGISFYTFQTISYTIDIYRSKMKPTTDPIAFFAYVSFFPQLVAGPIERAKNLLPQFNRIDPFSYNESVVGLRLILWGFFKKVVIADNSAILVNQIFSNYTTMSGLELMLGTIFFSIQIYCDFSGYSDIAIGVAKLFGFNLMVNFKTPYFSRDIAEFWRRWHISLSTWFRDYLYIPLGGSRVPRNRVIVNIFIIFIVSGFWHGANWTFIVWGLLNALYFLPLLLGNKNRENLDVVAQSSVFPSFSELRKMISTYILTCIAWVFFRSETVYEAADYIKKILINENYFSLNLNFPTFLLPMLVLLSATDWLSRSEGFAKFIGSINHKSIRITYYYLLLISIILFGAFSENEFIYFQF